jgi:hypothetical protein
VIAPVANALCGPVSKFFGVEGRPRVLKGPFGTSGVVTGPFTTPGVAKGPFTTPVIASAMAERSEVPA